MPMMLSLLLLLTMAGCASSEQFERPGTWKLPPTGHAANDANLRVMLVNPHDLVAGANEPASLGSEAVRPIELLLRGQRKKLPNVNAAPIGAEQGGGNGGGGGFGGGMGGGGAGGQQ